MKHLTIDIGNTSIKYAIFDERTMIHHGRIIGHDIGTLISETAQDEISHCCYCSTINLSEEQKKELSSTAKETMMLDHSTPVPIANKYDTPKTLGMDRLAAAIGAYMTAKQECLIIDMGTAITYDFVDKAGSYLGGNISPGMGIRFKALHEYTSKLPLVEQQGRHPEFGTDTESAIRCGVIDGIKNEIEGYIMTFSLKYPNLFVFFTGGDELYFEDEIKKRIFADNYLVLKGLNEVLIFNKSRKA